MNADRGQLKPIKITQFLLPAEDVVPPLPNPSRFTPFSDLDLAHWKDYPDVLTDSLWLFDSRDRSGAHLNWYHGNFVPQIPRQLMLRYTKQGDWVLDPFLGSGTTLIEARRMGRNAVGIELNGDVAKKAENFIHIEVNRYGVSTSVINADSLDVNFHDLLSTHSVKSFQLTILHPPYQNIIKFSDNPKDLSNSETPEAFIMKLGNVISKVVEVLDSGRFMALVIGDKYEHGRWIPLGFLSMQKAMGCGFELKSIVVKNFNETRGKSGQKSLWRYRALQGGYYIFKHEYIFIFQKPRKS